MSLSVIIAAGGTGLRFVPPGGRGMSLSVIIAAGGTGLRFVPPGGRP